MPKAPEDASIKAVEQKFEVRARARAARMPTTSTGRHAARHAERARAAVMSPHAHTTLTHPAPPPHAQALRTQMKLINESFNVKKVRCVRLGRREGSRCPHGAGGGHWWGG